jgi:hypothetical protein
MAKRHHRPVEPPAAPSVIYAGVHRLLCVLAGQPIDLFAGCSFPECGCTGRCVIADGTAPATATGDAKQPPAAADGW